MQPSHSTLPVHDFNSFLQGALGYFVQHCGVNGVLGKETSSRKGAARVEAGTGDARKVLTFDFAPVSKSVIRIFNVNYSIRVGLTPSDSCDTAVAPPKWEHHHYTSNRRHFGLYNVKLNILFKEISVSFRPPAASSTPVVGGGDVEEAVSYDFMSCLKNFFVVLPKVTTAIQKKASGSGSGDSDVQDDS